MIKTAQLRVYRPAEEVPEESPHPGVPLPPRTRRLGAYGLLGEPMGDDALVTEWAGRRFACPRHPRLRMLEGVLALHNTSRHVGAGLVPEATARRAGAELKALQARHPEARSHILTSSWHVPVRWFVAFSPEEREVPRRPEGRPGIRYRTSIRAALERLETAVGILKEAELPDAVIEEVVELVEWLSEFPLDSMVELDYGSVADLFSPADLVMDESVAEVWNSLDALAREEWEEAGEHYGSVLTRWSSAVAVTFSN